MASSTAFTTSQNPRPETVLQMLEAAATVKIQSQEFKSAFPVKNWEIRLRSFSSCFLPGFSHLHLTMFL